MNMLTLVLFPHKFQPAFKELGRFTHKAIPLDAIGKKTTKGTVETRAAAVEVAAKLIADGEESIVGLAYSMGCSVSSANCYINDLIKAGRVRKERAHRVNGVKLKINGA